MNSRTNPQVRLKSLTQSELLSETKTAIHEERLSTIKVLYHFREIERRRAYLGFSSLFDLATKHFGYSSAAAQRRISSMRLLKDLPEFEAKIESGELSLSAASSVQSYIKRQAVEAQNGSGSQVTKAEKIELLNSCLNKSSREVEKEIKKREPNADKRPDMRYSSENRIRMSLNISEGLYQKLEKLKYKYRAKSLEEVIDRLASKELEPEISKDNSVQTNRLENPLPTSEVKPRQSDQCISRHIPSVTKKIVLKANQTDFADEKTPEPSCCYKHPVTAEKCSKTSSLEFDHIFPFSKGGPHLAENLRLLCSHHNKLVWQTEQKTL